MTDYDPRIVSLYDEENPDGPDHDFYRQLAVDVSAESILDIGCGTGILTVTLARHGTTVVGLDPSPNMLAYARRRAGADAVTWLLGDSRTIPASPFNCALMTGNVVQHVPEVNWSRTLRDLHTALAGGGVLAFETRNPAMRAWEGWASGGRTARATPHGELVEWVEAEESAPGVVTLVSHNLFTATNDTVTQTQELVFRDRGTIQSQLRAACFDLDAVYGDWHRTPFTKDAPVMVFVVHSR